MAKTKEEAHSIASDFAPHKVANVNSPPWIVGDYTLMSDQDMTTMKHHILDQLLLSSVFTALLTWIATSGAPWVVKSLTMAGAIIGLKSVTVILTNLGIGYIQLHPESHPKAVARKAHTQMCQTRMIGFKGYQLAGMFVFGGALMVLSQFIHPSVVTEAAAHFMSLATR